MFPAAGAAVAARPAIWRAALPTKRILMGKIYLYAWDLALISATHVLLVGKIPAMKLDLAL